MNLKISLNLKNIFKIYKAKIKVHLVTVAYETNDNYTNIKLIIVLSNVIKPTIQISLYLQFFYV